MKVYEDFDVPWQNQYGDGSEDETIRLKVNPVFVGLPFTTTALYIFRQFQAILYAVHIYDIESDSYTPVLNPGPTYILKETDYMYIVTQSNDDMAEISKLVSIKLNSHFKNINRANMKNAPLSIQT
jgi:hypothetical protein